MNATDQTEGRKSKGPSGGTRGEKEEVRERGGEIKRGDMVRQETKNKAVIARKKRENRQWKRMCEKVWKV